MNQKKEIKQAIEAILGSKITMREDASNPEDELKADFIKGCAIGLPKVHTPSNIFSLYKPKA